MPRLPRFVAAGLLLLGAAVVLGALLLPGPVAAVVFVPLWYLVAVVNAWLGVVSAGYPVRSEIAVFGPVFGLPAAVAAVLGSSWAPVVTGPRFWFVWLAGVALWAAIRLLVGLLGSVSGAVAAGLAGLVFAPLWMVICVVSLVSGVRSAGYTVAEELPVLAVNAALPLLVALVVWRVAAGRHRPAVQTP